MSEVLAPLKSLRITVFNKQFWETIKSKKKTKPQKWSFFLSFIFWYRTFVYIFCKFNILNYIPSTEMV